MYLGERRQGVFCFAEERNPTNPAHLGQPYTKGEKEMWLNNREHIESAAVLLAKAWCEMAL